MKSQVQLILEYARGHKGITAKEADDALGVERLSARIYDIKALGYEVQKELEEGLNRYGVKTRYARYFVRVPDAARPCAGESGEGEKP